MQQQTKISGENLFDVTNLVNQIEAQNFIIREKEDVKKMSLKKMYQEMKKVLPDWLFDTLNLDSDRHKLPEFFKKEETDANFKNLLNDIMNIWKEEKRYNFGHISATPLGHSFKEDTFSSALKKKISNDPLINDIFSKLRLKIEFQPREKGIYPNYEGYVVIKFTKLNQE